MKRLTLLLSAILLASATSDAQAGVIVGFERWLGIHCGKGIHACNGCGPYQAYGLYDDYPEEVPPGISEMDELKSSRATKQPRTSNPYDYSRRPATR